MTTSVDELETTLLDLLARVKAGETILIASDGKDVAQISPCDPLARLERALPGLIRATMPASSIPDIRPWDSDLQLDAVKLIREEREDREFLR